MLVTYTLMKVSCVAFQVLSSIKATKGQANDGLSSALLLVLLDSAKNLPVSINTHTHTHTYTHTHPLSFFLSCFLISQCSTFPISSDITSSTTLCLLFFHPLFLSVVLLWSDFLSFGVKSVFEGHVGSGCLRERRSAGLVFCENTSALYRTMFVSHSAGISIRLFCLHLTCIWCINIWLLHLQMFHSYISTSLLHVKSSCNGVQTLRTVLFAFVYAVVHPVSMLVFTEAPTAFCIDINSLCIRGVNAASFVCAVVVVFSLQRCTFSFLKRAFEYRVSEAVQGNIFDYVHTATECGFQPSLVLNVVIMRLWVYC